MKILRSLLPGVVLILAPASVLAEPYKEPPYDAYPAMEIHIGNPAKLDQRSHPHARRYRTVLSGALQQGPNFAGHYVIANWGCGSSCEAHAIIDVTTGRVYTPKAMESSMHTLHCPVSPLAFRHSSRLIVTLMAEGDRVKMTQYLWEGNRLRKLKASNHAMDEVCGKAERLPY